MTKPTQAQKRGVAITRTCTFSGRRRVGVDTNVFYRIYQQPYLMEGESSKIFSFNDFVYTHIICLHEFKDLIMRDEKISEEDAKVKVKQFLKEKNVRIIYSQQCFINEQERKSFEDDSNKKLRDSGKGYLKCHPPDSIILLAFKKFGINRVLSTDEAVRICASYLKLDSSSIPSFSKATSDELRKIFGKKKY